jgi:plastocyanin
MRKTTTILLALLLALAAAGCGGGGGGGADAGDTGAFEPESGADYEVLASEYAFAPPFLLIDKPGTYTFGIINEGNEAHNFTIKGVGGTENAQPGETKTVELALKAGAYEIICTIPGHEEAGMFGTLNVSG